MYQVIFKSSGVVAFRAGSKAYAQAWMTDNDTCPRTGKNLGLFRLLREQGTRK